GTLIPADSYLVIARSRTQLLSHYPALSAALVLGDYSGRLGNKGDRIALAKPDVLVTTNSQGKVQTKNILVAQHDVTYAVGGRWGQWSSGGGSSMELIDPDADPLQPSSWADSDETQKAPWTQVSLTDVLENGNTGFSPTFIHIGMQGMGECLVDEVEVFKQGSTNLCLNGNFESTVSAQKWELKGNHSTSTIDTNGNAFSGNACLHVRSQGDADTGVNSIRRSLQAGLSTGVTATIRARIRWLAGWPQALFRVHGNYMALQAQMTVPTNLGTPGARNSRRIDNAGPAIYEVAHAPAIPRIGQQVLVTCRAMDPQGVSNLTLHYRFDPVLTYTNVVMADDGQNGDAVAGDGIYSGYLPARSNAGIVAFYIDALDGAATPAHTAFPASAPVQECLVRWGDAVPFTTYSHYHMWNTAAIEKARNSSIALDNTYRDMTLVYGNGRIIYNAGFRDKGSPYHSGAGDYAVTVPADDLLLGVDERIFGSTGNGGAEASGI
ncbi:MAG TPA: hypothetical protein PKW90_19310, partial [Myxococcota bacterium]|nr:hypothetical protein [Myxococcota bacterium]